MSLDEPSARRVVLVQAIETADIEGKLVSHEERSQIDQALRSSLAQDEQEAPAELEPLLVRRADQVLALVESRQPPLVALSRPPGWQRVAVAALPALTLLLGL